MSYTGALCEVRNELAGRIPDLAQKLPDDEFAIYNRICAALLLKEVDTRLIPEIDLVKTEQQTMSVWGGGIMRRDMIDGDGREATFKPGVLNLKEARVLDPYATPTVHLAIGVNMALCTNASTICERYTDGPNPKLRIMPGLSKRYTDLGSRRQELVIMCVGPVGLPDEIMSFYSALTSKTLAEELRLHLEFINTHVDGDDNTKLIAAHDTSYLPYSLSAHNVHESTATRLALREALFGAYIEKDPDKGRYVVWGRDGHPIHHPRDREDVLDPTLKCPLRVNRNLAAFIGATINASKLFGVFVPRAYRY